MPYEGVYNMSDGSMHTGCGEVVPKPTRYACTPIAIGFVSFEFCIACYLSLLCDCQIFSGDTYSYWIWVDLICAESSYSTRLNTFCLRTTSAIIMTHTSPRPPTTHHRHQRPQPRQMAQHHRASYLKVVFVFISVASQEHIPSRV